MEANQILKMDFLDILFYGKNKDYGAYDLRRTYNKRITKAMVIMGVTLTALIGGSLIAKSLKSTVVKKVMVIEEVKLTELRKAEVKHVLPKQKVKKVPVATIKVTNPVIVNDNEVMLTPPDIEEMAKAEISDKTIAGPATMGIVAPPEEPTGTQILAGTGAKQDNKDSTFIRVEIDAKFPGGPDAWSKFVSKAIYKELDEFTDSDFGTCIVQFIVDRSGNVSEVHAINMKGSKLAEVAVNSIRKGPKWIPALQNGMHVKALRSQPITLANPEE